MKKMGLDDFFSPRHDAGHSAPGTSRETRVHQYRDPWVPDQVPDASRCIFPHCKTLGFSERRLRRAGHPVDEKQTA